MKTLLVVVFVLTVTVAARWQDLDPNATLRQATIRFEAPLFNEQSDLEVKAVIKIETGGQPRQEVAHLEAVLNTAKSGDLALALTSDKATRKDLADAQLSITLIPVRGPARDRWVFLYWLDLFFSDGNWFYVHRKESASLNALQNVYTTHLSVALPSGKP